MKHLLLFFLSMVVFSACSSQKEVRKKGGIEYEETNLESTISANRTMVVPELLEEISGLLVTGDSFWGFNDSGGKPEIYELSDEPQSKLLTTIDLKGVENTDFESIAMSETQFFVGDFGNNYGNRKDLSIHYFDRDEIKNNDSSQKVKVNTIEFYYPEQENYENQNRNHDFDCEAMFYHNGLLHLFTKEWKSTQTHHYTLEIKPGKQAAKLIEFFDTQFLVTGADAIMDNGKLRIGLIGYTREGQVFFVENIVNKNAKKFFNFSIQEKFLGTSIELGQVEGIAYSSPSEVCISAERFKYEGANVPEHIACFDLE